MSTDEKLCELELALEKARTMLHTFGNALLSEDSVKLLNVIAPIHEFREASHVDAADGASYIALCGLSWRLAETAKTAARLGLRASEASGLTAAPELLN